MVSSTYNGWYGFNAAPFFTNGKKYDPEVLSGVTEANVDFEAVPINDPVNDTANTFADGNVMDVANGHDMAVPVPSIDN